MAKRTRKSITDAVKIAVVAELRRGTPRIKVLKRFKLNPHTNTVRWLGDRRYDKPTPKVFSPTPRKRKTKQKGSGWKFCPNCGQLLQ